MADGDHAGSSTPVAGRADREGERWSWDDVGVRPLIRGLRRRCPRCGDGALFERWTTVRERCPCCGLRYLLDQGDPWIFLLLFDRGVFILPPIAVLYFGLLPRSLPLMILACAGLLGALIYTTPHRYGFSVACDYLTRCLWGDLADSPPVGSRSDAHRG